MVFEFFKGQSGSGMGAVEGRIDEMLRTSERVLRLAVSAFEPGVQPADIGQQVRKTDRGINRAERSIRRELIVHVSAHAGADLPLALVYMSIIKDIERVGDYAKNIWDVASVVSSGDDGPDLSELEPFFARTADLILEIAAIYAARDTRRATETLKRCDAWLDDYDARVDELMLSSEPSTVGVPKALLFRHVKRITAHLMNVLTSVVMPFDRLDYFDEDKIDRD